ncbi:MAG: TAXI family TRAP transporter solute-binding subunit [Pseudoflavonifractor sp.]
MKVSKRPFALLLTVSMLSLLLVSCGKPSASPTTPPATKAPAAPTQAVGAEKGLPLTTGGQSYVLATQDVDTAVYTRCSAFLEVIGDNLGSNTIDVQPISTGGAAGALLVEAGQAQIATASNIPVKKLAEGTYSAEYKPLENVAALLGGTDITWGTVMFTDAFVQKTGYTTLEEIVANKYPVRIVTKAEGSFGMDGATDLLACLGGTWADIDTWGGSHTHIAPGTMADLLKEGQADISIDVVSLGQAAFTELCLTATMHVIELAPETRAAMNEKGYASMTMPANSWNGQTEAVETICGCESLVISKEVPDDVAYAITKSICENKDTLVSLVPATAYFEPSQAWDLLYCGIELHPGSAQYFRDAGYMK